MNTDELKPLPQKVDYNIDDHLITGRQTIGKKIIEWILTLIGWAILLSFVLYSMYGFLALLFDWYLPQFYVYNIEMLMEMKHYLLILTIGALVICVSLIIWKNYNLRKFGRLKRRKFRGDVTDAEIVDKFQLTEEQVLMMKNERVIVLEKNIVPEDLGMGREIKSRYE